MENCNQASSITAKRIYDFFAPPLRPNPHVGNSQNLFVPPQRFFGKERLGNHMMLIPFRSTGAGGAGEGGGLFCDVCSLQRRTTP